MDNFKQFLLIIGGLLIFFLISNLPSWGFSIKNVSIYYSLAVFVTLLAGSFTLLFLGFRAANPREGERREINLRVVTFSLRIAFTLGIGAVVVAIMCIFAVLGIVPLLQ